MRRRVAIPAGLFAFGLAAGGATGCAPMHRMLDRQALEEKASIALARPPATTPPGPLPFHDEAELRALTTPTPLGALTIEPLPTPLLDVEGIVQERVSFASAIPTRDPASARAVLYVFRKGPLGERPILLWVPGFGVSPLAFRFIDRLLEDALLEGADVVLLVPPGHLERSTPARPDGAALLATDVPDHLASLAQGLSDLRRTLAHLRALDPPALGAFGGSMGAGWLLRTMTWDEGLSFATLFLPLVSWEETLFELPELSAVRARFVAEGMDEAEARGAWRAFDARASRPLVPPARLSIFAARHDLLARPASVQSLADAWGITAVTWLDRGHADALLTPSLYDDCAARLREDLAKTRR